jgi:hypothetical protein
VGNVHVTNWYKLNGFVLALSLSKFLKSRNNKVEILLSIDMLKIRMQVPKLACSYYFHALCHFLFKVV